MNILELKLKVYLTKNIYDKDSLSEIAKLIDNSLTRTEKYERFHNEKKFKLYTHNSFFPVEVDRVYKAGRIYSITIRTLDNALYNYLKLNLADERTEEIKALELTDTKIICNNKLIEKLYSITPAIIKTDDGYWRNSMSLIEYEKRIKINLIKKYNIITNEKINEDFILFSNIVFNNITPVSIAYKDIKILGDKLDLVISNNEDAQRLAKVAVGTGIGEMNSRGYGFVNYKVF